MEIQAVIERVRALLERDFLYEDPASYRLGILEALRTLTEADAARVA